MSRAGKTPWVVVDTNFFVAAMISNRGAAFQPLESWRNGRITLLISDEQVGELQDVFSREEISGRYNVTPQSREALFRLLETTAESVQPRRRLPVEVRDPKDEKILAAALTGQADYLVTGDEDLLVLRDDPRLGHLRIVTVGEFLQVLRS